MAFIAQRELKVIPLGTNTKDFILYKPGDVIPDFDKWDPSVKRAQLNLEYVKEDPNYVAPKVAKIAKQVDAKDPKPRNNKGRFEKSEPKVNQAAVSIAQNRVEPSKPAQAVAPAAEEIVEQPSVMENKESKPYGCRLCDQGFESTKDLYTHVTLTHKKKE